MSKRYWRILSSRFMVVRLFLLALMMSIIVGLTFPALTQSPLAKTREELVQQIKKDAARHLELNDKPDREWVVKAYKDNKFKLAEQEISVIYEQEFINLKKEQERNPFEQLFKNGVITTLILACMVAIGTAIGAAFGDTVKKWSNLFFDGLGSFLYQLVAGNPISLNSSLQRYRKALITKYQLLKIPFCPNLPLAMRDVYVPLKVVGSGTVANIEAFEAVKTHRRLMVTGAPGSGKSMLLKSLMLLYAEDRLFSQKEDVTPILLELNRLSNSTVSIEQHLVESLGRDNFLKATWFVKQGLKDGSLMLLLDGLDELNGNDRPQVVKRIKDFLDTDGEQCRVVITCRTQVYNQEFNQEADQVLEIVEFSDQQIRRFLGAWKSAMPIDKSIEQLIQTLRERPPIIALARNPLLLTIIAYLYTDTTFILPHSRSEFYQQATDILLEKWDQSKQQSQPNQYRGRDKRQVLQVLALYNQDSTNQQSRDRRSMDYLVALEQVKLVLPSLNLAVENAEAILNEIVERSGLLLAIDGGQRYQFSHLTLQEFFAAAALYQKEEELVIRFEKDKDAWREVVKLWCGLPGQNTELIRAVYVIEPITAFECLADANNVAPDLADQMIEDFKSQLGNGKNEDVITSAFGAVAASNRQGSRGESVLNYLKDTLLNAQEFSPLLTVILNILVRTNSPKAVNIIAQHYQNISNVNHPLTLSFTSLPFPQNTYLLTPLIALFLMGDLSISKLVDLAKQGDFLTLFYLKQIATVSAALALVDFLWDSNSILANQAAWYLAEILPQPEIEEALRKYQLTKEQNNSEFLDWIWLPFDEIDNSSLRIIAGRIAYILKEKFTEESLPLSQVHPIKNSSQIILDSRIIIPLCTIEFQNIINFLELRKLQNEPLIILQKSLRSMEISWTEKEIDWLDNKKFIENNISKISSSNRWQYFFFSLTTKLQFDLIYRLATSRRNPIKKDWVNLYKPLKYSFINGKEYKSVLIASFIISIFAAFKMALLIVYNLQNLLSGCLLMAIFIVIVFWLFLLRLTEDKAYFSASRYSAFVVSNIQPDVFLEFGLLGLITYFKVLNELYKENTSWDKIQSLQSSVVFALDKIEDVINFVLPVYWIFPVNSSKPITIYKSLVLATLISFIMIVLSMIVKAGVFTGLILLIWSGVGLKIWQNPSSKENRSLKFLAILAFPYFCWFPTVLLFSSLAMYDFFSWQWLQILIAWIIIFGTCTALWQRGQKLDHDARNPLYGILDKQ